MNSRTPWAVLALSLALSAQAVGFATDTPYGVFARNGAASDHHYLPALTPITATQGVAASVTGGSASSDLTPDTRAIKIGEAGQVTLSVVASRVEAGTTPSLPPGAVQQGPHSLLMRISSPVLGPVRGRVLVALRGSADAGSKARLAIDVGNDNQVDYEQAVDGQPHAKELPVVFAGSLAVKITTDCAAERTGTAIRSSYALDATVEYVPGPPPFAFTQYGQGCGGLVLDGRDDPSATLHQVTISEAGAFPGSPGVLWIGGRPLDVPLPGTSCTLYLEPAVEIPFSSDALGNAVLFINVPPPLFGTAYLQSVSYTLIPMRFRLSNGVKVACDG